MKSIPKLRAVLSISTNSTGSHRTLYSVGTRADLLVHDFAPDGTPTYSEGVYVEMVTEAQAAEVRAAGVKGMSFSDTDQFNDWLCS
jgi:hypothetical protein